MIKLINNDILNALSTFEDNSVDCIVTSPPYWKGFEYEAYFNSYLQYTEWCTLWLRELKRVLKEEGTFYLNVSNDSETTIRAFELMNIATRKLMWKLHDTIIWYRYNQQPSNSNRQLTNQTEYIFMFRHTSNNIELNKKNAYEYNPDIFKTKNVGNVWEIPFNKGDKISFSKKETKSKWGHSGFPIALAETCILLSTKEDDVVLDPFMGSGTVGVACRNTDRDFIGIDLNTDYYHIAEERINNVQSKLI
jgi:DNA modification methylase